MYPGCLLDFRVALTFLLLSSISTAYAVDPSCGPGFFTGLKSRLFGPGGVATPAQLAADTARESALAPVQRRGAGQRTADAFSLEGLPFELAAEWSRAWELNEGWWLNAHLSHVLAVRKFLRNGILEREDLDIGEHEGMQILVIRRHADGSREVLVRRGSFAYRIRRGAEVERQGARANETPSAAGPYRESVGADQFWFVRHWQFSEMTEADRARVWSPTEFSPHEIHFEGGDRLVRVRDDLMDPLGVVWEHRGPGQDRGVRWSPPLNDALMDRHQAVHAARDRHLRLPSESEVIAVTRNRELFRFLFRPAGDHPLYWSSTEKGGYFYLFDGQSGAVYKATRNYSRFNRVRFVR